MKTDVNRKIFGEILPWPLSFLTTRDELRFFIKPDTNRIRERSGLNLVNKCLNVYRKSEDADGRTRGMGWGGWEYTRRCQPDRICVETQTA
uniref:Uncharacterized protein n=1 Tax=Vespula pensylvanica TaxID=30213 RepID=A0A834NRR3_VESPE|nr:hypothetical protein H0235_011243 [Vespula pensylvanica]